MMGRCPMASRPMERKEKMECELRTHMLRSSRRDLLKRWWRQEIILHDGWQLFQYDVICKVLRILLKLVHISITPILKSNL
jgi:hypothetical protein